MNILIIGSKNPITEEDRVYYQQYITYFEDSVKTTDVPSNIYAALLEDLIISVGDGSFSIYDQRNSQSFDNYDAFFLRGGGFRETVDILSAISEFAHLHNKTIVNDFANVRHASKLLQAVHFHLLNVPVAKSVLITTAVLESNYLDDWIFPCIMKATVGSHGNDNYVVTSSKEVKNIAKENFGKTFILQRFVPNDGDYRILIIGDDYLVIGRSAIEGSHLNNTSQGGDAVLLSPEALPPIIIEQSKAIMKRDGLSIAGVDVIKDKITGQYSFLEVNAQPQLMTGAFINEKKRLLGNLIKKLSDKS